MKCCIFKKTIVYIIMIFFVGLSVAQNIHGNIQKSDYVIDVYNEMKEEMETINNRSRNTYSNGVSISPSIGRNIGVTNKVKCICNEVEITGDVNAQFFDIYEIIDFGQTAWGLTSADFNNDGNVDFAVSSATVPFSRSTISIFYNDGNLGFTQDDVFTFSYSYIASLDSGDYDNDGDIDLLFSFSEWIWYQGLKVKVYGIINILFNDGGNNFGNLTRIAKRGSGIPFDPEGRINPHVTSADYDMDGDIDLLVGDNSGKVEFYLNNNGSGNFTSIGVINDFGFLSWGLTSADYDKDGDIDFLVAAGEDDLLGYIYLKRNQIIPLNLSTCFEPGPGEIIYNFYNLPESASLTSLDYEKNGEMDFIAGMFYRPYLFVNKQGTYEPFLICELPRSPEGYPEDLTFGGLTSADYNNDGYEDFVAGGVQGVVRLFINIHNFPPNKPSIDGPLNGRPWKKYTFTATASDHDGDNVSYFFKWGDGTDSGWSEFVPSGTSVSQSHSWQWIGTFTIKVMAKDDYGAQSDWTELTVTMPRNRATYDSLFLKFLEHLCLVRQRNF